KRAFWHTPVRSDWSVSNQPPRWRDGPSTRACPRYKGPSADRGSGAIKPGIPYHPASARSLQIAEHERVLAASSRRIPKTTKSRSELDSILQHLEARFAQRRARARENQRYQAGVADAPVQGVGPCSGR